MFGLVQVRLYTESELENSPRTLKPSKINSAPRLGGATGTTCIVRCECVCPPSIATAPPCMRVEGGRAISVSSKARRRRHFYCAAGPKRLRKEATYLRDLSLSELYFNLLCCFWWYGGRGYQMRAQENNKKG